MLRKLLVDQILNTTLSSMKGKKRWLVIIVLLAAQFVPADVVDLSAFIADLIELLNTAEG